MVVLVRLVRGRPGVVVLVRLVRGGQGWLPGVREGGGEVWVGQVGPGQEVVGWAGHTATHWTWGAVSTVEYYCITLHYCITVHCVQYTWVW